MHTSPQFIVFAGAMFSSKTTGMLSCLEKFKYQGRHIFAFKPQIDDRYALNQIVSHMGLSIPATRIGTGKELIRELMLQFDDGEIPERSVVAVDEMFMIPGIANELIWLYKNGITVIVSTLDLSYACEPFDEVTKIFPWATVVKKCVAVCSVCKEDAHYTWRKPVDEEKEIVIGGVELYEARCRAHHPHFLKTT